MPRTSAACPRCGWTVEQLRNTGLLGCAACYEAFAPLVAQAVTHLQSADDTPAPATAPAPPPSTPSPPAEREPLPWPTRRAQRSG